MIGSRDGGGTHIMANVDQDDRLLRNSEQFRPSDLRLKNEDMPRLHRVHLDNSLSGRRLSRGATVNCDTNVSKNLTSAEAMPPSATASSPKLLMNISCDDVKQPGSPGVHHSPSSPQLGAKTTNVSASNIRNMAEPSYGDESSTNAEAVISTTNMVFYKMPQDSNPHPVALNAPVSTMFYANGDREGED